MIDIYMIRDESIDKSLIGLSFRASESLTTYLQIGFTFESAKKIQVYFLAFLNSVN